MKICKPKVPTEKRLENLCASPIHRYLEDLAQDLRVGGVRIENETEVEVAALTRAGVWNPPRASIIYRGLPFANYTLMSGQDLVIVGFTSEPLESYQFTSLAGRAIEARRLYLESMRTGRFKVGAYNNDTNLGRVEDLTDGGLWSAPPDWQKRQFF